MKIQNQFHCVRLNKNRTQVASGYFNLRHCTGMHGKSTSERPRGKRGKREEQIVTSRGPFSERGRFEKHEEHGEQLLVLFFGEKYKNKSESFCLH